MGGLWKGKKKLSRKAETERQIDNKKELIIAKRSHYSLFVTLLMIIITFQYEYY